MAKKISVTSNETTFVQPFEFCKDALIYVTSFMVYRPVFTVFVCSSVTFAYLISTSPKMQRLLISFPYDKYISKLRSQKMIAVYATVLEVVLELLTAVVLAGVSIIVTLWLLFEEASDRKKISDDEYVEQFRGGLIEPKESKFSFNSHI